MTTHTPGPWVYESGMVYAARGLRDDLDPGGIPIARMDRETGNGTQPAERDMNARLIAAAPDMLAALEALIAWDDKDPSLVHAFDLGRAAIAKATKA